MTNDIFRNMNSPGRHGFRHYILLVKIYKGGKVELQNMDIITNGIKSLLELRRIHSKTFTSPGEANIEESIAAN